MNTTISQRHRPTAVKFAVSLLLASSGISIIDLAGRPHPQAPVMQCIGSALIGLLFAWAFLVGKGWVRWVFLAPVAVGLLTSPGYFHHASAFGAVYFCLQGLRQVVALALLFLRPSNEWFRSQRHAG
jgi:hypothetical protein